MSEFIVDGEKLTSDDASDARMDIAPTVAAGAATTAMLMAGFMQIAKTWDNRNAAPCLGSLGLLTPAPRLHG